MPKGQSLGTDLPISTQLKNYLQSIQTKCFELEDSDQKAQILEISIRMYRLIKESEK